MSVRSVDVQTAIARTQEAERVQRAQNDVARAGQQAFAAELSRRAEERSHKVTSSPRSEQDKIHDEKGRRDGRGEKDAMEGKGQGAPARAGSGGKGGPDEREAYAGQGGGEARPDGSSIPGRIIDVEV